MVAMGIDLIIKNTNTDLVFNAPAAITDSILDDVCKHRGFGWKHVGTPCFDLVLDLKEITGIREAIQSNRATDAETIEDLLLWFDAIIDCSITPGDIILKTF